MLIDQCGGDARTPSATHDSQASALVTLALIDKCKSKRNRREEKEKVFRNPV